MSPINSQEKRTILVYFLIDTSGSMLNNHKIDYLNKAMHETIKRLKERAKKDAYNAYLVRTCCFGGNSAHFVEKKHIPIENYEFQDITGIKKGDKTPLSSAFNSLNLSLSGYAGKNNVKPYIILVTDGASTDNYKPNLRKFLQSEWANNSYRAAIAIGDKAIIENINEFVGNMENIKRVNTNEELTDSLVAASMRPIENIQEVVEEPKEVSKTSIEGTTNTSTSKEEESEKPVEKKPAPEKPTTNFIFGELNSEDAPATLINQREEDDDDNSISVKPSSEEQSGNSLIGHDDDEI